MTATAGDKKVNLSWTAVEGATGYNVKRSTTAGGPYETIANNITGTTYTDTNVNDGTTYYYVVTAVNDLGESANSNEVSATPINPTVTLEVTSVDKAKLGDEITANIVIHNATNICAEDLKIAYDTSKLQFISAENADGMKIYKENDIAAGIKRYITACLGKANAANGDKVLITLKFKAKGKGEAKIDITNGRIADNATLEEDVEEANCGEKTVLIEGVKDVNRTGEYTLLDLGIDAWYYGSAAADTDSSKYDADQIVNGTIDDGDLTEIVAQILNNSNYSANK
ncbi:MAG TPA: cohesin domain-containing protein [Ruminiclostridium sp.]|nr:cohesin domain-containing protein [Ruminiclostridium sp.]